MTDKVGVLEVNESLDRNIYNHCHMRSQSKTPSRGGVQIQNLSVQRLEIKARNNCFLTSPMLFEKNIIQTNFVNVPNRSVQYCKNQETIVLLTNKNLNWIYMNKNNL